jgi:hypothetical protein
MPITILLRNFGIRRAIEHPAVAHRAFDAQMLPSMYSSSAARGYYLPPILRRNFKCCMYGAMVRRACGIT